MERDHQIENNPLLFKSLVGKLILAVNNMAKKPKIDDDLSGVLDTFIEKLNESEKYLSNGIFNTNFAEAALLLQSSVELYGKKVDLLWDSIIQYQKHIITYEKDSADRAKEAELINDRQNRFKRKRKIQETGLATEQTNINELMNSAKSVSSMCMQPCETLQKNWDACISANSSECSENNNSISSHCLHIIDMPVYENEEVLAMTAAMNLNKCIYELTSEYPNFKQICLKNRQGLVTHFYEHDIVLQKYLKEKQIDINELEKLHKDSYKTYLLNYLKEKEFAAQNVSARLAQKCAALCPKHVVARVQRLSQDVLLQYLKKDLSQDKIKRASSAVPSVCEADSEVFSGTETSVPGVCEPEKEVFSDTETAVHNESGFADDLDTSATMSDLTIPSQATSDSAVPSQAADDSVLGNTPAVVEKPSKSTTQTTEINIKNRTVILRESNRLQKTSRRQDSEEELPKPKRKRIPRKVKLIIKATVPAKQFEKFFCRHYEAEEGEGQVPEINSDSEDETEDRDDTLAADSAVFSSIEDELDELHAASEPVRPSRPVVEENIIENVLQRIKENQDSQKRVKEWKSFIDSKLERVEQQSDFDIHEYGTKIIDDMRLQETKKFRDIVQGRNPGEVAKYFLATLQLANTYNVDIIQPCEGALASDTLELKLLSKERHHESLEDFMAPSEETFQERLARVQALNPGVPLSSTPHKPKKASSKVAKLSRKDNTQSFAMPSTSGTQKCYRTGSR